MIPVALDSYEPQLLTAQGALRPPAIVAPAPREVSFGRIAGRVSPGTVQVLVKVGGVVRGSTAPVAGRFELVVDLPPRDARVRVIAVDALGHEAASSVGAVYGLPQAGHPTRSRRSAEDRVLARRLRALTRRYPGIAAFYVQDLRSRRGAAWNARAQFPAASTVKVAIAIEVLRDLRGRPARSSSLYRLLWSMIVHSDNAAANALLEWLGGSTSAGSAEVNETLRRLGIHDSLLYGGYALGTAAARPIPLSVVEQPAFGVGKYTTAYDLARLHTLLHMAAARRGALHHLSGRFSSADARFLMWVLAHVADHGKLDRFLPARVRVLHKAGWITRARHDAGIVYARYGSFVAAVMTWRPAGVSSSSDVLAGKVARAALRRFQELRGAPERDAMDVSA
jgi:beta-lactamase class A